MTIQIPQLWKRDGKRDRYPISKGEKGRPIPLPEIRSWLLDPRNQNRICNHLDWYLGTDYTGRLFEWFLSKAGISEDPAYATFSPWDVLAIESLSVGLPPQSIKWLLEPDDVRDGLVKAARESLESGQDTLWTCNPELLEGNGALSQLYELLRSRNGFGKVTTSKILAAKFPGVVPIRDAKVEALLDMTKTKNWWLPIRSVFGAEGQSLADYLNSLPIESKADNITALRRFDIILWMEAQARQIKAKK